MTRLVLAGGTDVAEVALFSVAELPADCGLGPAAIGELEQAGHLLRFNTGADGGYLLHAYVDEPIPPALRPFCSQDDKVQYRFTTGTGQIAFGGIESAFRSFARNPAIRSDGVIPPGSYELVAFHTDFPDEMHEAAIDAVLSAKEQRLLGLPGLIFVAAFLAMIGVASKRFVAAGLIAGISYVALRFYLCSSTYRGLQARREEVDREYPSIVVEMRSCEDPSRVA